MNATSPNSTPLYEPVGVIFDLDGTLVDSFAPHLQAWQRVAKQYNFVFPDGLYEQIFGTLNRDYLPDILGDHATPQLVDEIDHALEIAYLQSVAEKFPAMPGAAELVRSLYESTSACPLKIAIGSSGPKANVEAAIQGLGMKSFLSAVVSQDDVAHVKPDPEIFLTAAKRMGIPPERCVVVEDSTFGIAAAKAAGMACIGFQSGVHRAEEYVQADWLIHSLGELDPVTIVRQIPGMTAADLAVIWHSLKPKRGNCAQAVAKGLGREDLLESLATCGGGRAPEGHCGALHATLMMLPVDQHEEMRQAFRELALEEHCRPIRQSGQTSCSQCVRIAAQLLEERLRTNAEKTS